MATPLGHGLAGAAIAAVCAAEAPLRQRLVYGAALGIAADLDFLPGLIIGDPARFHHSGSHTLLAVLVVASVAWVLAPRSRVRWALLAGTAYGSHLLLDFFTHDDSAPQGIPLLWPLWGAFVQSSIPIFPRVIHSGGAALSLHNIGVAARELVLLAPVLWLATRSGVAHHRHRFGGPRQAAGQRD